MGDSSFSANQGLSPLPPKISPRSPLDLPCTASFSANQGLAPLGLPLTLNPSPALTLNLTLTPTLTLNPNPHPHPPRRQASRLSSAR